MLRTVYVSGCILVAVMSSASQQAATPQVSPAREAAMQADAQEALKKGRFVLSSDSQEYRLEKPVQLGGGRSPASDPGAKLKVDYQIATADGKPVYASFEGTSAVIHTIDFAKLLNGAAMPASVPGAAKVEECTNGRVCVETVPVDQCVKWKCK
jgi:hypothetical protein